MRHTSAFVLLTGAALLVGGCPPENYDNLAPATLRQIDPIREATDLTPQEMRTQLEDLGLDPSTINGLLQDKPLGNQFGGDLRTLYAKLTAPSFTELTPDELQIFASTASSVDDTLDADLNDEEAQAVVTLFKTYDLNSPEDLDAFLGDPANVVPPVIPDGVLRSLFIDFDPELLLPELG